MKYGMLRLCRIISFILTASLISSSCTKTPMITENLPSQSIGVTLISTQTSSENRSVEAIVSSSETITDNHSDELFTSDFFVLDNSDGFANIYEIEVNVPRSWSEQWIRSHGSDLIFEEINTSNWTMDYYSNFAASWYLGSPFVCTSNHSDHQSQNHSPDDSSQVTYTPPAGTTVNTTKTIHAVPVSSIPDYEELPIYAINGELDPNCKVVCLELDTSVFPLETGYLSASYDKYNLIGVAQNYVDGIPVGGAMSVVALPAGDYVYEYGELVGPTRGGTLIMQDSALSRNKDALIGVYRTKDFTVKKTIYENLPIKPVLECKDGILDALDYSPLVSSSNGIQFYAAELVYMPISEFDMNTKDYLQDGHTYLVPVWHVFFRSAYDDGGISGTGCIRINAVSGESMYSKDYPYQDNRVYSSGI